MKRKTHSKAAVAAVPRSSLPDDACPTCGTVMVEARGTMRVPVNGEQISVPGVKHLKCPGCHEIVLRFVEARRLSEDAVAIYRKKHRLLLAHEIRAVRDRFGLTQGDLARLLRLGANTISRWEAGRNVQTGAMDLLLRLIRDLPGSYEYLREKPYEQAGG
jgi:putative zinc finger/helix-turn-helix YgiT family protein